MTISANTPARRTPLQVAEADLLEADDRVDEQTARVLRLEADLTKAYTKRRELIRFRDWRAGNPLLDDSTDAHVKGIRERALDVFAATDDEEPDLEEVVGLRIVQLVEARVPDIGDLVMVAVDGRHIEGEVVAMDEGEDEASVWVDVHLGDGWDVRALLVLPTEKG